jgi:hypothetical protein
LAMRASRCVAVGFLIVALAHVRRTVREERDKDSELLIVYRANELGVESITRTPWLLSLAD